MEIKVILVSFTLNQWKPNRTPEMLKWAPKSTSFQGWNYIEIILMETKDCFDVPVRASKCLSYHVQNNSIIGDSNPRKYFLIRVDVSFEVAKVHFTL